MSSFGYIDTDTGEYVTDPFQSAFHELKNWLFGKSDAEIKLEQLQEKEWERNLTRIGPAQISKPRPYHTELIDGHYHLLFDKNAIPDDVNAPVDIEFANWTDTVTIYNNIVSGEDWDTNIKPVSITFKDGTVIDENTQPPETQPPKPKGPSYNRFHPAHVIVTDDIPVDRTKKPNEPLEENTSSIYAIIPFAIIFFAMT